jgi:hypothetical protein
MHELKNIWSSGRRMVEGEEGKIRGGCDMIYKNPNKIRSRIFQHRLHNRQKSFVWYGDEY